MVIMIRPDVRFVLYLEINYFINSQEKSSSMYSPYQTYVLLNAHLHTNPQS